MYHSVSEKHSSGFTLVELMLYAGILAAAGGVLVSILFLVTRAQSREVAGLEVMRQSQFVLQRVQSVVREASTVDTAFEGSDPAAPCVQFCTLKVRTGTATTIPPSSPRPRRVSTSSRGSARRSLRFLRRRGHC